MDIGAAINLAKGIGFDVAAELDPSKLVFMPEVRDMCAADKCRSYNRSWSCPPACGELPEIAERCRAYGGGMLVQTVGQMENEFDFEAIAETSERHNGNFNKLTERLHGEGLDFLPMGAGACMRCESCTYPDSPCRFPELVFPSMEACGLLVSRVCSDCGVPYYHGKNSICFVGCFLMN